MWRKIKQQLESNLKPNWIFFQLYLLIYMCVCVCVCVCRLVYNLCICMVQLKKFTITHIWIQIIISLSFIFFILISFGYIHEFTLFFFIGFFDNLFILDYSSFAPH